MESISDEKVCRNGWHRGLASLGHSTSRDWTPLKHQNAESIPERRACSPCSHKQSWEPEPRHSLLQQALLHCRFEALLGMVRWAWKGVESLTICPPPPPSPCQLIECTSGADHSRNGS